MRKQVDKVEHQLKSVHSSQKKEVEQVVEHGICGLKTEILSEMDKEIEALETRLVVKMNEPLRPQELTSKILKIW